jgi:hypothetical protein
MTSSATASEYGVQTSQAMKISQHVYFGLKSETILPSELVRRAGLPGDRERHVEVEQRIHLVRS